jgi:hypothetical protein
MQAEVRICSTFIVSLLYTVAAMTPTTFEFDAVGVRKSSDSKARCSHFSEKSAAVAFENWNALCFDMGDVLDNPPGYWASGNEYSELFESEH